MKPTNILIINDFAHVNGGASQVALSSAIGLAREGYRVTVFSAVKPIMPELSENGVEVICTEQSEILKNPSRFMAAGQGLWNLKAARILSKKLETCEKARTVIHFHSWTKALSSSVIRVALNKGFKVVCTLHDYFMACPNGGFFNYQTNTICNLRPLSLRCITKHCDVRSYPQKSWRVVRQFIQRSLGMIPDGVHHYIFVSNFSLNIMKKYLPSKAHFYFVPNPVESNQNAPPIEVSKNSAYLMIGRLSKEKGVLLFAEAAKAGNCNAVFVGDGEYRSDIRSINPHARITGWVSHSQVHKHLERARAVVFPSLVYEAQPLVVLEAASCGIPIIVSDSCAAREMVCNGVTGLWFKSGNIDDLVKKMQMLQDNNLVSTLGQASYKNYWMYPSPMEKHVATLQEVYHRVLAG